MDAFVGFLVIGLVIIAVLLGAFSVTNDIKPDKNNTNVTNVTDSDTTKFVVTEGFVGKVEKEIWRSINFGKFNTSYLSNKTSFSAKGEELRNGLFFGSNEILFTYNLPSDHLGTTIDFEVKETNRYAPLQVKVNNHLVKERKFPIGKYSLHVNNSFLSEKNNISLKSLSSGWRIWAPAYYNVPEITIKSQSLFLKSQDYHFNVFENEKRKFTKGWLSVNTDKRKGTFIYDINGKRQFEGKLKDESEKLNFNKSSLKIGENTLTIKSDENAQFSGNARLIIYHISPKDYVLTKSFNISQNDYKNLGEGEITFSIKDKVKEGGIKVSLNGKRVCYSKTSCYPTVEENKNYKFKFTKNQAKSGGNELKIESIDESAFVVKNLKKTV